MLVHPPWLVRQQKSSSVNMILVFLRKSCLAGIPVDAVTKCLTRRCAVRCRSCVFALQICCLSHSLAYFSTFIVFRCVPAEVVNKQAQLYITVFFFAGPGVDAVTICYHARTDAHAHMHTYVYPPNTIRRPHVWAHFYWGHAHNASRRFSWRGACGNTPHARKPTHTDTHTHTFSNSIAISYLPNLSFDFTFLCDLLEKVDMSGYPVL